LQNEYPILEFDPTREAMIEPWTVLEPVDVAEHCVICFFREVIAGLHEKGQTRIVAQFDWESGGHRVYEIEVGGRRLALFHPSVGAPQAAILLEKAIALGCSKFVACGGAGVLAEGIAVGHVIVPDAAVRDEGTSYHYLPPGREVVASPEGVAAIVATLEQHGVEHAVCKTWTTDAPYRETRDKVQLRRSEGCLTVEMEAAAFFAVARFRGVTFAQLLYAGDDLSGEEWDRRNWDRQTPVREQLFWLAAEACLRL
jgi:uridine phosphorylase